MLRNTDCMLINVNLDKHHFDSFAETIKIKNALFNVIKKKLSNNDKLIIKINSKIKEIRAIFLAC